MSFLQLGRVVRGVIQGESRPQELIPRLVDFLMRGDMPVERMTTFYPLAEINRAAQNSSKGTTIKPVLRMPHWAGTRGSSPTSGEWWLRTAVMPRSLPERGAEPVAISIPPPRRTGMAR